MGSCSDSSAVRGPAGCSCWCTAGCGAGQCRERRAVSGWRGGVGSTAGAAAAVQGTPALPAYGARPVQISSGLWYNIFSQNQLYRSSTCSTRGGKTILNGFATPRRIFGLAFKLKKGWKKIWHIFKFAKLKSCSKLPSSTVPYILQMFRFNVLVPVLSYISVKINIYVNVSVSDPDPHGSGLIWLYRIRTRIQEQEN